MQDGHEQDGRGLREVDQPPRLGVLEDPPGIPDVLIDDRQAGVVPDKQRPGMGQHDGVGIDVDDARVGLDQPGHLVRAALAGQAGAEVKELRDALLCREAHRRAKELPVGLGNVRVLRGQPEQVLHRFPV